jgi:hypothetical protein
MANTITIQDAVARMVNVGKIPMGVSLIKHLDDIVSDAEKKLEIARELGVSNQEVQLLERCINAGTARYTFAGELMKHIEWELDTPPKPSVLKVSSESGNTKQLELSSVAEWARVNYGIERFDYEELSNQSRELPNTNTEKLAEKVAKEGLTAVLAKRLYITFALALEELVSSKKNPTGFGTADDINVAQTAESLYARTTNPKNYDTEILKSRIEVAIAMKKMFGKN